MEEGVLGDRINSSARVRPCTCDELITRTAVAEELSGDAYLLGSVGAYDTQFANDDTMNTCTVVGT